MKKSITLSVPSKDIEEDVIKESDWKNIIFLPFKPVWEKLVIFSVLINILLSIFDTVFCSDNLLWISLTYYTCEFIFFIDTILLLVHRKLKRLRKKRVHKKADMKLLTLDILSLAPINQIQPFLTLSIWYYEKQASKDYLKLKCLVRLYRIINYFDRKMDEAGSNELLILTLSHIIRVVLISQVAGAIIYLLRSAEGSWIRNLSQYKIDQESPYSWVTLCYILMGSLFIHNWHGTIKPETKVEKLIFILTMLIGYTFHIMLFLGYLTSMFKKIYTDYYEYETKVVKIVEMLEDWNAEDDLKQRTSEYYSIFWQKRMGIKNMPEMFEVLPASLRKEVTVDLFWNALKHSHFFVNTDMSFKRSISLVMMNRFLLPGEFLFRIGEPKGTMVYLTSGVLQVLSDEDDNSPILSFSHGTLLGETSCLLAVKSLANVRSATYCEIQTLDLKDLHRTFVNCPAVAKNVKQQLFRRLEKAKRRHQMNLLKRKGNDHSDLVEDPPMKKLKRNWKIIYDMDKKQKKGKDVAKMFYHDTEMTVENFDLIALSKATERSESVCLSGKCPYIMNPDSSFRIFCEFITFTAVIIQSLVLPQAVCFQRKLSPAEKSLCFLMDVIYFLDVYLQFATAVKVGNTLITDFRQIVSMRLKQTSFLVDLLSSLPFDFIMMLGSTEHHVMLLWKLLRLLKIYKVHFILEFLQRKMILDMIAIKILKYVLLYIFSMYWLACLLYGLSCIKEPCHKYSWLKYSSTIYGYPTASNWQKFWSSLYLTITLFLNYGESNYDGFVVVDIILLHVVALLGHLIYSYGFAELTAMLILKNQAIKFSNSHLRALKKEATQYNISTSVRANALNFLQLHDSMLKYESTDESDLFKNAPFELKNEILRHRIINNLRKVPLFADSSDDLLRYICIHSELKLIPQDSTILSFENKTDIMYVIMKGYCRMYSSLPGDLERKSSSILQSGDMFPFLESFHDAFSFMMVQSLTAVEILLLPTRIILNAFQTNERDNGCFKSALAYHKQVYGSILFRKGARLPMLRPVEKSKSRGPMFEFAVYDVDYVKFSEDAFREPFKKLGGWSFIRFFLMRKTINPNGKFYICWEISRCFFALAQMIILISYPNMFVLLLKESQMLSIFMFFSVTCLLDLYARLHCQYYNEKGILVTHPLKTAEHYVATSFVIDCIGVMPIQSIGVQYLLGKNLELWLYVFLCFSTRYLQLYRLYNGMSYLEEKYEGVFQIMINRIKYVIFVLVSIGVLSAVFQLLTCNIEGKTFVCTNWLMEELKKTSVHGINNHFLYSYYKMSGFFTLSTSGDPSYSSNMLVAILIAIPLYIYRWSILSQIVSKGIGGNTELTTYRNRMKNYLHFLKGAKIDIETMNAIIHHYEYTWKKSHGINMNRIMKYFHPHLEQDLTNSQYSICLEQAHLFRGEHENLFRAISPLLHREYYTKNSKIIRCNDVQSKIFFVQEGSIKVTVANTTLAILSNGGMFGCLTKAGITRQTLTATTVVHSTVLTIDSKIFHSVIASFPKVQERIKKINLLNSEYLQEHTSELNMVETVDSLYDRHKEFFDAILIRHDHGWYPKFEYIMDVHINPLTALLVLEVTFIHMEQQGIIYWRNLYYIIYLLDVLHLIEVLLKFHVTYEDSISGKVVKDPYLIRKRLLYSTFWYHFFTLLPFDIFVSSYVNNMFITKFFILNRAARFIFLVLYYHQSEAKISMKKHLRWTYMIYKNLFYVQILVCVWMSTCPNTRCSYNDSTSKAEGSIRRAETLLDSIIIGYLHVINIYTISDLRSVMPNTPVQLIITIIISLITLSLTAALCNGFTSLIMVERHNFSLYQLKLNRFWIYLKTLELSPFLCKKIRDYCLLLWEWQRGCWLPILIQEAPNFLKQDLLLGLYGKHLSTHYLFAHTHVDFLRQLVGHLERTVFLPGYSIVEKGDLDNCMYFINKGEVDEVDISGKVVKTVRTLSGGMSFGETQGLLCSNHTYSYRANTSADILILDKNRWKYLLNWFPASKEEIIERALEYGLFSEEEAFRL